MRSTSTSAIGESPRNALSASARSAIRRSVSAGAIGRRWNAVVKRVRTSGQGRADRRSARLCSQRLRCERVAALDVARGEAGLEPALALRRRAVRERVGHGVAARLLLQRVVADRRRGVQRRIDVAWLQPVAAAACERLAHTPAKQSACSSRRTDSPSAPSIGWPPRAPARPCS